ncbi:MAG: signal peptidase II [Candidatus Omnitrophica bacterium]|nr:signal peptidase II [Candidatus Omnitrophota bacterium]MCF7894047.1 signal peptidase II [Candidatus Omnitrophota bacterium]
MLDTEQNVRKKSKKKKDRLKLLLTPSIAFFIIGLDFWIKTYLRLNFSFQSFPLIDKLVYITVVFNTGTAFGFLQDKANLLVYLTLILILIFLFVIKKEQQKRVIFLIATGLVLGGAFSNLIDRLMLGAVVDYIDLKFWPVFNLSDSCITIGAILLIIDSFRKRS